MPDVNFPSGPSISARDAAAEIAAQILRGRSHRVFRGRLRAR